ncbi:MAG: hypothetical protein RR523_16295 [Cetobacterium sp.]
MKNIKQIDLNRQKELYKKYHDFINELYLECLRLVRGSFVKRVKFLYPIDKFTNAHITLVNPEKQAGQLNFDVDFLSVENMFVGGHNFGVSKDEIQNKNILMFCLNITEFIDDVIGKNK